jgi:hypothetical protein
MADNQRSKCQRERPERYVGESTTIPNPKRAVLSTPRYGSGMYGAFREEEVECRRWGGAGMSNGLVIAD